MSTKTVCWEFHGMDFHDWAVACKPYIIKHYAKCQMKWCKAHCYWTLWTLEHWKCVLWSDKSRFSMWQSDGQVCVWWLPEECYLPDFIVTTVKFGDNGMRLFYRCWARHLTSSRHFGQFYASNFMGTIWEGSFLPKKDCAPVHKARSIKI